MNNKYARYTHTRNAKTKKMILTVAVVLAIVFSIGFCGIVDSTAYAAAQDVKNIGTYLSGGQGLVLGANTVRPTTSHVDQEYLTGNSASESRFGDDFYFDLTTSDWDDVTAAGGVKNSVGYTTDGFYLNYFTDSTAVMPNARSFSFQSKIRLTDDSTLASALNSQNGRVNATVSLDYQYYNKNNLGHETEVDAYDDSFDFEVVWAPNGVVSNSASYNYTVSATKQRAEISLTLDAKDFDADTAYFLIKLADFETNGADSVEESTQTKYTTGIFVRFSNVTVSVVNAVNYTMSFNSTGARVSDNTSYSRDDAYTIYSGDDSVYFEANTVDKESTDYTLSTGDVYVKDNDMLYLYSDVYMKVEGEDAVRMPLAADYANSVNSTGKAIQWTYTDDSYFSIFTQNLILYEYNNTADQTSGRTTVYRVNYQNRTPGSELMIEMRPKIISSYVEDEDNPGYYIYNEVTVDKSKYTRIYIDNVRPETPIIASSDSSNLGKYGYDTAIYGNITEQNIEKRYTSGLTLSFALENYQNINTKTGTAVAPEGIYYTVNGDNPTNASSTRYRATLNNSGVGEINLNTPANGGVGKGSGFYEIKLATIDAAGNYSDVVTYKIVVDNKNYEVNTSIVGGLSQDAKNNPLTPNLPSTNKVATIAMSQGEDGTNISTASKRTYKRGSDVVIRVEMTETQMDTYQLVSIYNTGIGASLLSWTEDDIVFTKEGSKYVYSIKVKLDKYIDPYLDEDGNVLGFGITTPTDFFYVYDGGVYSEGSGGIVSENKRIGDYDPLFGIISVDQGAYQTAPRLYRIILEGDQKGLYALTADSTGDVMYDGVKYVATMVASTLINIDSKTVDLIGTSATVRNFYFAFKQKVDVNVSGTTVTFDYTDATATTDAIATQQAVSLDPIPATVLSHSDTENFAGLKEGFDVKYYRLISTTYATVAALQVAMSLEDAIADGHVVLYTEGGEAVAPRYAGEYWYTASINVTSPFYSDYFYREEGTMTILKANPMVSGNLMFGEIDNQGNLVQRTLVYGSGGMETMNAYLYGLDDNGMPSNTITTIGVMGKYTVSADTPNYNNPKAGTHVVTVNFVPDDINTYGNNKYAILNSQNISSIPLLVYLTVSKASVSIAVDEDSLTTEYNKSRQVFDVRLRLHDDLQYMTLDEIPTLPGSSIIVNSGLTIDTSNLAVSYLFRTSLEEDFSSSEPVNAGLYDVKIIVSGDNYQGELILSDRYFEGADRIVGSMDGDYVIGGEKVDVATSNSTVSQSIAGYVVGGTAYYIVGDKAISYVSAAERVSITTDGSVYTVSEDGVITRYALVDGVFYLLTAIDSQKGVDAYEKNASYLYSNYYVVEGTKYYYDNASIYTDVQLTTVVGSVKNNKVLSISGVDYYIDSLGELSVMTTSTVIADRGLIQDVDVANATATIYVYNGEFAYDGEYYVVKANDIYKRMVFEIAKKVLEIETGFEETYDYTYYTVPTANSAMYAYSMVLAEDGQMRPEKQAVEFSMTYQYSATEDGEYTIVTETDMSKFLAGYYKVQVDVSATNYQGSTTDVFRIKRAGLSSPYITVNQPEVYMQDGMDGHASYGQTIADLVLSGGNSVNVKYQGSKEVITVGIKGNYRPALRQNAIDGSVDDYTYYGINVLGEKTYADTVFSTVGTRAEGYNILFVPTDLVNFEPFVVTLIVKVVPATPLSTGDIDGEWDAKFTKDGTADEFISYGDTFAKAVLNVGGTAVKSGKGSLFFYYGTEKKAIEGRFSTVTSANTAFTAGQHVISYTFVPTNTTLYKTVNFDVTLDVQKKGLTLSYVDANYTVPFGSNIDVVSGVSNTDNAVVTSYDYKVYKDRNLAEEITYSTTLGVGNYYIEVTVVDDNYQGSMVLDFVIEKATPIITSSPLVDNFEWNMALSSLDLNNHSAIVTNALSQEVIGGTFSLSYDGVDYTPNTTYEEAFKASGLNRYEQQVVVTFTPSSDYVNNYNSFSFEWTLVVNRVTLQITDFSFSDTDKVYTASPLYPTVTVNIDGVDVDYTDLVEYSETPIVTGDYNLTVTVKDADLLYRGSVTTAFTISKRSADDITVEFFEEYIERGEVDPITPWSGVEIVPSGIFTLTSTALADNAPITYNVRVSRGATVNAKIIDVGRYTLHLTFSGNYTGEKQFDFVVRYKEVSYRDAVNGVITRTYTADSLQTGRVIADVVTPDTLSYTVEYAPLHGAYSTTVPYKAGTYHARLRFEGGSNNGYDGYDSGVRLVIKPATTSISATKIKDFVYTGSPLDASLYLNECFEVTSTHASITSYNYLYSLDGDSWQETPMTDAGDYYMLITPGNQNFDGELIYPYTIKKADLEYLGATNASANRIETVAISYSAYVKGDNDNAYFTTESLSALTFSGRVIEGYFIIKERDTLSTLYKGTYDNYEYEFVPTGDDSLNLNSYIGTVSITIDKLDISTYVTFDESSLTQTYTGSAIEAKVRFKTEEELGDVEPLSLSSIVKESILSSVKVRYGNSTNAPINATTYALTTASSHDNYLVNISGTLTVEKATPVIVTPDYFRLQSDVVTADANNVALNALKTIYALSGDVAIAGTFEITGVSQDSQYVVNLAFTPDAGMDANVNSAVGTLRVVYTDSIDYVSQSDIVIPEVPNYGVTLESIVPTLATGDFSEIGEFSWLDQDTMPAVGTHEYTLVFTPSLTATTHYNVQTFTVQVTVGEKKTLTLQDLGALYLDVTVGGLYQEGTVVVSSDLYKDLTGFSVQSLSVGDIADVVTAEAFRGESIIATLSFAHTDYNIDEVITAKVTLRLASSAFRVSGNVAEYAGRPLTKQDLYGSASSLLKVTVTDAGVLPRCTVTIFNKDRVELQEIPSIGDYTVVLSIDRSMSNYAGSTTVTFTMTAEDLSSYILVNGKDNDVTLSKVYSQSLSIIPSLDLDALGGKVDDDDYELLRYYKKSTDSDDAYSLYAVPYDAGQYDVKVVISNSDYYKGEKVFSYTIEKKTVSISLNGYDLVSGGGYVLNATYGSVAIPTLAIGEGVKTYTITYADDKTTYLTTPQNAGEYTATVSVQDANYQGVATFVLSIAKKETVIITEPTLSPIDYGTLTRNATMSSDWQASVDGTMTIVDGDSVLNAGQNTVSILFTPHNENYESRLIEVTLTVNRAVATLTFNTTELVYTGEVIDVSYTKLSFVDDSDITFSFYTLQGATLTPATPITAGEYYVRVVVGALDGNYYYTNVTDGETGDYTKYQKIIIKKADAVGYVLGKEPTASNIEYGYALLGHSYITGDVALYDDGKGGTVEVKGVYTFKNGTAPQFNVQEDLVVELVFTPNNQNYAIYYCTTTVDVIKALVNIAVTDGTAITYGDMIEGGTAFDAATYFTFEIDKHNDLVPRLKLDDYTMSNYVGKILPSGNYNLKVVLDHDNYRGELSFVLAVQKKTVDLTFFEDSAMLTPIDMATGYAFVYQQNASVYAGVSTDLEAFSVAIGKNIEEIKAEINAKVVLTYTHIDTGKTYSNISNVTKSAGRYRVVATLLTSTDYTATAWTYVTVNKANIGRIELDPYTLRQQTYGSVAEPIVYIYNDDVDTPVRLTGVRYYIHWGDSTAMPTSAGEHNATVIVDDPNYVYTEKNIVFVIKKKAITLINIVVQDKVHDGTPWLPITAEMSGAILGDEVGLSISAHTEGKVTTAGKHNVTIFNYSLYGLHKDNYYIVTPAYNKTAEIYSNVIYDEKGTSYILFSGKTDDDYTFEVQEIESTYNKTGFISTILGQSAQVVSFSVRQDGLKVQLEEPVQVYVKIPEKYRDRVDLDYAFVGASEDEVVFNREGDYVSFYTTVSGEIVFVTSAFPYGIILIATGLVLLIGGILLIYFLDPSKKKVGFSGLRRKTPVDEAYRKLNEQKIKRDNTPPQYEERKRKKK